MTRAALHRATVSGDHGPWLVMAHGLGGSPAHWDPFVEAFRGSHRVLTFAQAGSTDADPRAFSVARHSSTLGFADDLSMLCGEMGVRDAVLIGHSIGGNAGVLAAAGAPDLFSRLVLINCSPRYVDDEATGYHGGLSHEGLEALLDSAAADYQAWAGGFGEMVMGNPDKPEYAAEFAEGLRKLDPQVALVAFRAAFSADFRKTLARVRVPTLVLQSRQDPAVPMAAARWMAARIPAAQFVELPNTGHFPHVIDPAGVIDLITPFVTSTMERLAGHVKTLLDGSGACAAVIWARDSDAEQGSVIYAVPAETLPPGTAWPRIPHSGLIQHDATMLMSLVPTSLRLDMPAPPAGAVSMPLADPELSLLLVWCDPTVSDSLPDDLSRLISEEISYDARILRGEQHAEQQAERLQSILDALAQGVVSVDHNRGLAEINCAAANLLGLPAGEVTAAEFASAMHTLLGRALNAAEITAVGGILVRSSRARIDCELQFLDAPRRLHVSSHGFTQGLSGGRVWVFEDVTALAEARESIETANALMSASADSMLDPQVLYEAVRDSDGRVADFRYLSVNRATTLYLQVPEDDLVGKNVLDTFPSMLESGLFERYAHCLDTGEPVILDDFAYFNELLEDARRYDIRAARAGPNLLSLTWSDVTERYQAARRLAESEEKYRLLTQNSTDAVAHVRDGVVVWMSPAVQDVIGMRAQDCVGRAVREVIPREDLAEFNGWWSGVEAGGALQERFRVRAVDGATHWVHVRATPFYDSAGERDGSIASLRLIDVEVAAEEALDKARREAARADALFRRSIDNAAVGMCLTEPEGRLTEVNDALCEFFGYDAATLTTKTWQDITAPEYLQADLDRVEGMLAGRLDSYRTLKQFIHADGHLIWGDLSVSCIRDSDGRLEQFLAQIIDVTVTVEANELNIALNRRLTDELQSAATYVESIMPRGLSGKVDVTSRYLPSRELGGDCFDYTWIDDDHLIVYLIDVSGHGIEPALLAVSVQNLLRSGTLPPDTLRDPAAALTELNRLFQMEHQGDHFFTIWYGVYERPTRTLRYASAGAPPAYAFTAENPSTATELHTRSAPIGAFDDTRFTAADYAVPPGCRILIYSDGASEIPLPDGHQLTQDGFQTLATRLATSPDWTLDDLIDQLRGRAANGVFTDDLSLIRLAFD